MKKAIALIGIILACIAGLRAQNLAFYFELIPEAQLPHVKPDMRKGMVGLYELGQTAKVPNQLNGICVLDTLSDSYLSMHTTDVSTLSIKMFENKADTLSILAVVHSVNAVGTVDSNIEFFTNTWSKLPTEHFITLPTARDFFKDNDTVSFEEFSKYCIPLLIEYKIDDELLTAAIDPEKYLPVEIFKQISPALSTEPVEYRWNGRQYVR